MAYFPNAFSRTSSSRSAFAMASVAAAALPSLIPCVDCFRNMFTRLNDSTQSARATGALRRLLVLQIHEGVAHRLGTDVHQAEPVAQPLNLDPVRIHHSGPRATHRRRAGRRLLLHLRRRRLRGGGCRRSRLRLLRRGRLGRTLQPAPAGREPVCAHREDRPKPPDGVAAGGIADGFFVKSPGYGGVNPAGAVSLALVCPFGPNWMNATIAPTAHSDPTATHISRGPLFFCGRRPARRGERSCGPGVDGGCAGTALHRCHRPQRIAGGVATAPGRRCCAAAGRETDGPGAVTDFRLHVAQRLQERAGRLEASSGSFASAVRMISLTAGGKLGFNSIGGTGGRARCALMIANWLSASNGFFPVTARTAIRPPNTHPSAYPPAPPWICSGDI